MAKHILTTPIQASDLKGIKAGEEGISEGSGGSKI